MNSTKTVSWGAIFDWDGVIIDSSSHHKESWERLATESHLPLPTDHFIRGFGCKNEFIIPEILDWTRDPAQISSLSLRKEELYRTVVRERGLQALPGVRPWLEELRRGGIPCAIGSSTHRANIDLSLSLIGLGEFFSGIVTAENVSRGKPDPEVFLRAAESIDRPASACIVFEDAHVGIAAARSAGMRVIGVATTHPIHQLLHTDLAVERLDRLQLPTLSAWFAT